MDLTVQKQTFLGLLFSSHEKIALTNLEISFKTKQFFYNITVQS